MTAAEELNAYIHHCKLLLRDIRHALADYRLRARDWTLYYAVDFSEIYSYVVPDESHETSSIPDGWSNDPERQFYVLSRFFGEPNILLPEAYAVELAGFVDLIASKQYTTATREYLKSRKEVQKILHSKETQPLLERVRSSDTEEWTDKELDDAFKYFEKNTPSLIAFARGRDLSSFDRFKDLLARKTIRPLEKEYPEAAAHIDEDQIRRRFVKLSEIRTRSNPASNYIDARALGEVEAVNAYFAREGQQKRVLLVSRSQRLMDIAAKETSVEEACIRHPRTVSTAYLSSAKGVPLTDEHELNLREKALDAFVTAAEEARPDETLKQLLKPIQDEWRSVEAYATGLAREGDTRAKPGSSKNVVIELLELIRDPTKLRARMVDHIKMLFAKVRRERDTVAFRLQQPSPNGMIVYSIESQYPKLTKLSRELASEWVSGIGDAKKLFDVAIECADDYDFLLGVAVSLGAIGRWSLALQYVEYALSTRIGGDRREGLFLRAVTMKRMSIEDPSISTAQETALKAVSSVDEAIDQSAAIDPRYYNERAVLKLWVIEFGQETAIYQAAEVAKELRSALPFATGKLKIQILNNLCYAALIEKDFDEMGKALETLKDELSNAFTDRSSWPISVRDTVVYTTFLLHRDTPDGKQQLKSWSNELNASLDDKTVSSQERRLIGGHANEIAEYKSEA